MCQYWIGDGELDFEGITAKDFQNIDVQQLVNIDKWSEIAKLLTRPNDSLKKHDEKS